MSALFTPDAVTLAAIVLLLVTIALAACLVPALRVSRVNPAMTLRHE
jgi:ABC-type lipoprotein release transport system permease subunit